MNCEEFKIKIGNLQGEFPEEAICHLSQCPQCDLWMSKTIKEAPEGLAKPIIDSPPFSLGQRIMNESIPQAPWYEKFVRNFIAAMSLAAAGACILLLMQNNQFPQQVQENPREEYSFLTPGDVHLDDIEFIEPMTKFVTEEQPQVSKSWSFLETEESLNFLDENEEEHS